jgi:p-methyltransferase
LENEQKSILILKGIPPLNISFFEEFGIPIFTFMRPLIGSERYISIPLQTLGAVTLATYLKRNGVRKVRVGDFYEDEVDVTRAGIVGISSTFMEISHVNEIAKYVREKNPLATIVMGGQVSWSFSHEEILDTIPEIDIIVCREGENTFIELIAAINSHGSLAGVKGIAFREGRKIVITPLRDFMNLSELTPPDWGLVNLQKKAKILPIETARGCIYDCAFCSEAHYWAKPVRFRNVEDIIKEIKLNVGTFGIKTFRFVDSCFTAPEERCGEICDAIFEQCIQKGLGIKWTSYARINNLSRNLLERMKRAGCVALDIGMESGDTGILEEMKKNYSGESIVESLSMAKDIGIITHCNIVVGFPGETETTINNTIDILNKARPDTYDCMLLDVAPHTYIYDNPYKYGIKGTRMQWEHNTMKSEDAVKAMFKISNGVSSSINFPGAEYCACMLSSFGYSTDEIKKFYLEVIQGRRDGIAVSMVGELFKIIKPREK